MSVLILRNSYFIDGLGLMPRIKSVIRDNKTRRWRIVPTNDNDHLRLNFSDYAYGSAAESFKAAMKTARNVSEVFKPGTKTIVKERKDKQVPLECPGVMLKSYRFKRRTIFFFAVSNPLNHSTDIIQIGDELNVMDNWSPALQHAKGIRSYYLHKKRKKARLAKEDAQLVMGLS